MAKLRLQKGESMLACVDKYVVIDIETTGLDTRWDSIIEVCAVRFVSGERVDSYKSLVNPHRELDDFIVELTGITNEMVSIAPDIEEVLSSLLAFVGDAVLVGHNINFDVNFLYDEAERIGLGGFYNNFIDTMRLGRRVFPNMPNHRLATMVDVLGITSRPAHRAEADCNATAALYERIKERIAADNIDLATKRKTKTGLKATDIAASVSEFDEEHPLFGKVCVFTGALSIPRREAMQLVADVGGINADGVTKTTNFLILGNTEYNASLKGAKSSKQKKAEAYILAGQDLTILSEVTFFDLLKDSQVRSQLPLPENKMSALQYEYAERLFALIQEAKLDTEYLRFFADEKHLDLRFYYQVLRIEFTTKKVFIVGKGDGSNFLSIIPTAPIIRLTHNYHIELLTPDDLILYQRYIVEEYKRAVEQLRELLTEIPDAMEKSIKRYCKDGIAF
ncbi:MAG: hypothetical protein II896_03860 [Clostridia bacterium]|nr:hypothetical protein [Clostridia bacterium]